MLVTEVMSADLVTCPVDASLRVGVGRMLENRVGSVIVDDGTVPVGIVTETDVLRAGYATERPFDDVPIQQVMSRPLRTVSPDETLRGATRRMREEGVKKLVVVEDIDPIGIVTTVDIVDSYPDLKSELAELIRHRPHGSELDPPDFEEL